MKRYLKLIFVFLSICYIKGYSQCGDVYTDINANTSVCGLYGDANGNSNWSWEITDINDPNYCKQWYARTSSVSTKLTTMGSPFVNSPTSALDLISQAKDFTKAKGWELLQRDFGCSHITAYPYFVLYNKYSGLLRVYVYQPETQPQYSSILVQIEPTKNPWPATTAIGDDEIITPDKYLNSNGAGTYGKSVVAVTEQGGSARWLVAEFNPAFDPNIQNAVYTGTGLKFTLFGVTTNLIKAVIKGRSVTSSDPSVYSFNYVPKVAATSSNGQDYGFTAQGEKFIKYGKSISELRNAVKTLTTRVEGSIASTNPAKNSLSDNIKSEATTVKNKTDNDFNFSQFLETAANATGGFGTMLKFVGDMIGLFSSGSNKPAAMPTYTSYDLELQGTLTAKAVQESFIIRVPGTVQPNNDNASYYKCPVGIFNIKNTPQADTVIYTRVNSYQYSNCCVGTTRADYVSYKMRNNLNVSFNSGAGLDLISVQAAIVGKILPDANNNASYDLFAENMYIHDPNAYYYTQASYNFMRPDLEAGRLVISTYDTEKKLHSFQTPYVNIECINGLAFNARKETNVVLRIKAVLKRHDDPANTPIIYIHDYNIEKYQGSYDPALRARHNTVYSWTTATPYSNYTELPTYTSDKTISGITYSQSTEEKADNSITTQNGVDVIVPSGQNVVYKAGAVVDLQNGFHAISGSEFKAVLNNFGYNITCGTRSTEAFVYPGNCYNSSITALRAITEVKPVQPDNTELKIYPTPTTGNLVISGLKNYKEAIISVIDESGRYVQQIKPSSTEGGILNLNVSSLDNGVYFIKIQNQAQIITRKIVVNK